MSRNDCRSSNTYARRTASTSGYGSVHVVAAGELEHQLRLERALDVEVELGLREARPARTARSSSHDRPGPHAAESRAAGVGAEPCERAAPGCPGGRSLGAWPTRRPTRAARTRSRARASRRTCGEEHEEGRAAFTTSRSTLIGRFGRCGGGHRRRHACWWSPPARWHRRPRARPTRRRRPIATLR